MVHYAPSLILVFVLHLTVLTVLASFGGPAWVGCTDTLGVPSDATYVGTATSLAACFVRMYEHPFSSVRNSRYSYLSARPIVFLPRSRYVRLPTSELEASACTALNLCPTRSLGTTGGAEWLQVVSADDKSDDLQDRAPLFILLPAATGLLLRRHGSQPDGPRGRQRRGPYLHARTGCGEHHHLSAPSTRTSNSATFRANSIVHSPIPCAAATASNL
jgi:hypothetical protein